MPKFHGVQKGEPIFMTIKMFFGQTEIKIEAHIRDRVFTFTSAFETLERGLLDFNAQIPNSKLTSDNGDAHSGGLVGLNGGSSSNLSSYNNNTSSRPPSLPGQNEYGYPSPARSYPRSERATDDDSTFYDGDSKYSNSGGSSKKKLFGIKFSSKRK